MKQTVEEELAFYKQIIMDLIDRAWDRPMSTVPRTEKPAKIIWTVHGDNPCDIRRYAYSHQQAIDIVDHRGGLKNWNLYKLVRVNKRKADRPRRPE